VVPCPGARDEQAVTPMAWGSIPESSQASVRSVNVVSSCSRVAAAQTSGRRPRTWMPRLTSETRPSPSCRCLRRKPT
jgi:hypothetical protein